MIMRGISALVMVLLLAGCTSTPQLAPSPVATPKSAPTAAVAVPTKSAALTPPVAVVPPVRIQVPSEEIDIPVGPVGIDGNGLLAIPSDIFTAGWYKFGPVPGATTGSTVITAHVDSYDQGLGPFAYLKQLTVGADVTVSTADGVDHRYTVESVQQVQKTQLPLNQIFDKVGAPRLVLLTCGGQFDESARDYSDNVVVIANPAP